MSAVPPVIDSHHHLWPADVIGDQAWRPSRDTPIRRAFEGDEFAAARRDAGVDGSVLMQSVDDHSENDRLLAYASADPAIRGVVGWLPLTDPTEARSVLESLIADADGAGMRSRLSGVRCLIGTDDLDWAVGSEAVAMFRAIAAEGLAWDVVPITAQQRAGVAALSRAVPELRIVIDHLAAPPIDGEWAPWTAAITELAESEHAAIKLSVGVAVLDALPAWDADFVRRAFEHALDAFGPSRAMLGSNWPVVELRTSYAQAWQDQTTALAALVSEDEARRIIGGTAVEWYELAEGRA